jgi:hypothetical protein
MLRLKALFRARAIRTPGQEVYQPESRVEWLAKLPGHAVRFRAESLSQQLDILREIRQKANEDVLERSVVILVQAPSHRSSPPTNHAALLERVVRA